MAALNANLHDMQLSSNPHAYFSWRTVMQWWLWLFFYDLSTGSSLTLFLTQSPLQPSALPGGGTLRGFCSFFVSRFLRFLLNRLRVCQGCEAVTEVLLAQFHMQVFGLQGPQHPTLDSVYLSAVSGCERRQLHIQGSADDELVIISNLSEFRFLLPISQGGRHMVVKSVGARQMS